jgi:hypothetical protein
MTSLTPQELVAEIQANGLNLAQIARRCSIPMTVISDVHSGGRKWIRYTFVDALRALLRELQEATEDAEAGMAAAAATLLNGHPTDIAH